MDITQIRLKNYKALILKFRNQPDQSGLPDHGILSRFAEKSGVSARYLSHINHGRKNIGAKVARAMEEGFGLERGWMDNDHEKLVEAANTSQADFLKIALKLFDENPVAIQSLLMRYMLGKGNGDSLGI